VLDPLTLRIIAALVRATTKQEGMALDIQPAHLKELGDVASKLLPSLKGTITWELYVATVAMEYAPNVLKQHSSDDELVGVLEAALKRFVASPSASQYKIPPPDQFFSSRTTAVSRIASFLGSLLAEQFALLDRPGVRAGLTAAAETIVDAIGACETPANSFLISGMARLLASIEATPAAARVEISERVMEEFLESLRNSSIGGMTSRVTIQLSGGELALLKESSVGDNTHDALQELCGIYEREFRSRAVDGIPLFSHLYIDPIFTRTDDDIHPHCLFPQVDSWLEFSPRIPLVVLGDPGAGKTSACLAITHRQMERVRESKFSESVHFPIYIPLRVIRRDCKVLGKKLSYELATSLKRICLDFVAEQLGHSVPFSFEHRRVLLLLDGFDELALLDEDATNGFLDAVGRLAQEDEKTAILLTGRTFSLQPHFARMDKTLLPERRWLRGTLQPFSNGTDGDVQRFVINYLISSSRPNATTELLKLVTKDGPFSEVAQTPVLLSMICASYGQVESPPISDEGKVDQISVLKWLVDQAVMWRANPQSRERERLSDDETSKRLTAFQTWAWDAVRSGGTDFAVSKTSPLTDTWLVEFFVSPSADDLGRASFVHRTIAEFLAAQHVVQAVSKRQATLGGSDALLHLCQDLAVEDRALDAHLKELAAELIRIEPPERRHELKQAACDLVSFAFDRPASLRWKELSARTLHVLGLVSEIAVTFLLAADDGVVDSDVFEKAVTLRAASPRSHLPWQVGTSVRHLSNVDLSSVSLIGLDLSGCEIRNSVLKYVDLTSAQLRDARLRDTVLLACDLDVTDLSSAVFTRCRLEKLDFSESYTDETKFIKCSISDITVGELTKSRELLLSLSFDSLDEIEIADSMGRDSMLWVDDSGLGWNYDSDDDRFVISFDAVYSCLRPDGRTSLFPTSVLLEHVLDEDIRLTLIVSNEQKTSLAPSRLEERLKSVNARTIFDSIASWSSAIDAGLGYGTTPSQQGPSIGQQICALLIRELGDTLERRTVKDWR
jgi:hypothetical protein